LLAELTAPGGLLRGWLKVLPPQSIGHEGACG
jgi:hypothetical protein